MRQIKVSLKEAQIEFINEYKAFGFKDRGAMIREALMQMQKQLEDARMRTSAELYAELYETDVEMQEWTNAALENWPK